MRNLNVAVVMGASSFLAKQLISRKFKGVEVHATESTSIYVSSIHVWPGSEHCLFRTRKFSAFVLPIISGLCLIILKKEINSLYLQNFHGSS